MATNTNTNTLPAVSDPVKSSAFDLIERNIMRDVESARKTDFLGLEELYSQNTFGGMVGRLGLETFDRYRNTKIRCRSYVNQAYQSAVDHYNFLLRREELTEEGVEAITYTRLTLDTDAFNALIPMEVIRLLTVGLMMLDAGAPMTEVTALKQSALTIIERNVTFKVENTRRTSFQALTTETNQHTFGGLAGRIGLETLARYRLSEKRIKSYINQALQEATDHHNFIARREAYSVSAISFMAKTDNGATFEDTMPCEVIRLLVLAHIESDNAATPHAGAVAAAMSAQSNG